MSTILVAIGAGIAVLTGMVLVSVRQQAVQ